MTDPADPMPPPSTSVRIRMYRQGLGDCFLLRFDTTGRPPFHLLIDTGVIKGTSNPTVIMREVAEDIARETGGVIDVLIVTHEHWDHVSGFLEAQEIWDRITVREVWLAWTENPKDALAKKLRSERRAMESEFKAKMAALAGGPTFQIDADRASRINDIAAFLGLGAGAAANPLGGTLAALNYAKGKVKKPRYWKPGDLISDLIPGVRIYVLGPPHNEKQIKKSNPSTAHPEVYSDPSHAFAFSDASIDLEKQPPFGPAVGRPVRTRADYDRALQRFFPTLVKKGPDPVWRRVESGNLAELERLALALDSHTNNTSLALVFELEDGRVLLFPADAQVGNWLSWQDCKWKKNASSVTANTLLARTVFYKVGHHGSHNATLKALGLEKMTHRGLIAAVPVNVAMAKKKRWKMPFAPLHKRLKEKTNGRVILSDATQAIPDPKKLTTLTAAERKHYADNVKAQPLFIDFTF